MAHLPLAPAFQPALRPTYSAWGFSSARRHPGYGDESHSTSSEPPRLWTNLGRPVFALVLAARLKSSKVRCWNTSRSASPKLDISSRAPQMPFWLACLVALLAGSSVAFQVGATMVLNDTPAPPLPHAVYVTVCNLASGGLWLLILSWLQGGPPPEKPKQLWSMLGGFMLAPGFVCTPTAALLGTQMTLTLLLMGTMTAAFVFDWLADRLRLSTSWFLGMGLLLSAVAMQASLSFGEVHGSNDLELIEYSLAAAGVGACYTAQARMNNRLASDLGSSARAAAFCNLTALLWGLPACILLVRSGVPLYFRFQDWWLWLYGGLQSAFYTYCLAEMPKVLGYSVCFILVSTGNLCTAAFADTVGLFREPFAVSPWRYISVAATLLGAVFLTVNRVADEKESTEVLAKNQEDEVRVPEFAGLAQDEGIAEDTGNLRRIQNPNRRTD